MDFSICNQLFVTVRHVLVMNMKARRVIWRLGMAFLITACCGCASSTRSDNNTSALTNLGRGISLADLSAKTGAQPQHQFAAQLGTNELLCVKLLFQHPRGRLYFVFQNGRLAAVHDPPRVESETYGYFGKTPRTRPNRVDPEDKMNTVLLSPDLSHSEIGERLEQWSRNEAVASKGQEPNVLPAFIIIAPLWLANTPSIMRANDEARKLTAKLDAFKIKLGMKTNETMALFGEPTQIALPSTNCILHIYGSRFPAKASGHHSPNWVTVRFCDGEATRVFSHDFIDQRLIEGL